MFGAVGIALGAWLTFPIPGTDIPQTAQTIAVLACGALLGWRGGCAAVLLYLLAGALGLPVYSDGGSGWQTLIGSSAGYFAGFVLGAGFAGKMRGSLGARNLARLVLVMLAGHGIILLAGWLWLSRNLGLSDAYTQGVAPFYYGAAVKSLLTTILVVGIRALNNR